MIALLFGNSSDLSSICSSLSSGSFPFVNLSKHPLSFARLTRFLKQKIQILRQWFSETDRCIVVIKLRFLFSSLACWCVVHWLQIQFQKLAIGVLLLSQRLWPKRSLLQLSTASMLPIPNATQWCPLNSNWYFAGISFELSVVLNCPSRSLCIGKYFWIFVNILQDFETSWFEHENDRTFSFLLQLKQVTNVGCPEMMENRLLKVCSCFAVLWVEYGWKFHWFNPEKSPHFLPSPKEH